MMKGTGLPSLAVVIALTVSGFGATYRGKSIDGIRYNGTAKDGKMILDVRVQFEGRNTTIYAGGRAFDVRLVSEVIDDPHHIEALEGNDRRWVIKITDRLD